MNSITEGFKNLNAVAANVQKKVYNQGINRANRAVQMAMRQHIKNGKHVRTGTLLRSIRTKVVRYRRGKTVLGLVGVQSRFTGEFRGKPVIAHKIAHFVTNYRRAFWQKWYGGHRHIGAHQPDDFVAKTEAQTRQTAITAVEKAINGAISNNP